MLCVLQVANLVAIAMGDTPLFAPQFVYVTPPPPISASNRMPSSVMNVHNEELMNNSRKTSSSSTKNEPKGWKKASDKVNEKRGEYKGDRYMIVEEGCRIGRS